MLNDASVATGNQYTIERRCLRYRCGTKRATAAEQLARGKREANVAMRAVHQFCGMHFPPGTGVELGSMLKMSAPVTALRISTGSLGDATGCPEARVPGGGR